MLRRQKHLILWTPVLAFALLAAPGAAIAGAYPSNKCASAQLKAAGKMCRGVLGAWSGWTKKPDDTKRDDKLAKAETKFTDGLTKAEEKAAKKGGSCALTQELDLIHQTFSSDLDTAIAEIVTQIQDGLNLTIKDHQKCGASLLKAAAGKCSGYLKAESKLVGGPAKDPDGAKRAADQLKASDKFSDKWDKAVSKGPCPTTATKEGIEALIDALTADAVVNTTVAPDVPDDAFMAITHPPGADANNPVTYEKDTLVPQCQDGSAFSFFAKRGSENKLLMYYYGGGACWNHATCYAETCTQTVGSTPPGLGGSGFGDLEDPNNPFVDWHVVRVPYCGCDIHLGDRARDYDQYSPGIPLKHVEHRGYDNAKLAEKWAREHFVSPTDIFVTGSSAGSYGAMVHGVHLNAVYPASSINVMGDGGNGVATREFMATNFNNWGAMLNLPDVPGIPDDPNDISIPVILNAAASFYPLANWSNYSTAYDGGGGGQTGFYNIMLAGNDAGIVELLLAQANWHEASCQWGDIMRQQAIETYDEAEPVNDNYRYYIASGSVHTGFGNPRVYYDTTGGVPPLVDWVNAMIADDPSWVNVQAAPYNVLFTGECNAYSDNAGAVCDVNAECLPNADPNDPDPSCWGDDVKPDPLLDPFKRSDPNNPTSPVIVDCP
jgi:hypothetical protein